MQILRYPSQLDQSMHALVCDLTDFSMSTAPEHTTTDRKASGMAHSDALAAGVRLDEFEIKSLLGVGGFGMVYLAFDHSLHREVAIKEYMPTALAERSQRDTVAMRSASDSEAFETGLRSFIAEARLLAQFDHPSLVKVFRFWEANNTAYMVMPLYRGMTLKEARSQMRQPPSEAWLRKVIWSILQALKVLHSANTMHRDVSPDNIFLQDVGPPVLLDLGAARRALTDKTQKFTAILKVNYAPIEQYADSLDMRQGPWTDLYALAAVVHGCLTSEPPPPATFRVLKDRLLSVHDIAQTIEQVLQENYSPAFCAAMDHALQLLPEQRPQSAADFEAECGLTAVAGMGRFDWRGELGSNWLPIAQQALPESYAPTQMLTQAFTRKNTAAAEVAAAAQMAADAEKTLAYARTNNAASIAAHATPATDAATDAASPTSADAVTALPAPADNATKKQEATTQAKAKTPETVKSALPFAGLAAGLVLASGALWSGLQSAPEASSAAAGASTAITATATLNTKATTLGAATTPAGSATGAALTVPATAASAAAFGASAASAQAAPSGTATLPTIGKTVASTVSATATVKADAKTAGGQVKAAIAATKSMLGAKPAASATGSAAQSGTAAADKTHDKSNDRAGEKAADKNGEKARNADANHADQASKAAPAAAICADSNFLSRPMCVHNECQKPQNAKLAVCVENNLRYKDQQGAVVR